jgi:glycosyltransferase involved in cell wall biosynthesis
LRIFVEDREYPDRVTHATGYGEVHRRLILALDAIGEEVFFPGCGDRIRDTRYLTADARARLLEINERHCPDDADTAYLQVATPHAFRRHDGRLNIGLTMTERESLAYYQRQFDWVGLCNAMDAILTPTEWNKDVFERHGIQRVRVAPLGVESRFFGPRPLKFLSVVVGLGRPGSRSNWKDIIQSYRDEFRDTDDVVLTILTQLDRKPFSYSSVGEAVRMLPGDLSEAVLRRQDRPRVVVKEGGELTPEEMRDFYLEHDCFVSYSREGWGFPTLEAMACSLDVIACDYGAPLAYLRGSPALLFGAGRLSEDNLKFEGGDLARLRKHMRDVYARRRQASEWARRFTWEASAREIARIVRDEHSRWKRGRA